MGCLYRSHGLSGTHVPVGLEGLVQIVLCANHVGRQTADAVGTGSDGVLLDIRDAAAVAADTACVTGGTFVAEARRRYEI